MSTGKRKASALTSLFASYGSDSDEDGEIKEEGEEEERAVEGEEGENENEGENEDEDATLALGACAQGRAPMLRGAGARLFQVVFAGMIRWDCLSRVCGALARSLIQSTPKHPPPLNPSSRLCQMLVSYELRANPNGVIG
eukprot:1195061-Prorocentrum_minimum.AAC.7